MHLTMRTPNPASCIAHVMKAVTRTQDIVAISRRPLDFSTRAQPLRLDLTDRDAVTKAGSAAICSTFSDVLR